MAEFRTIHTAAGLIALASAEASGTPINLTHMAVGDGNGNPVMPEEAQTNLARELFRATINRVFQDPVNPKRFTAELVIPASAGGFVLREVGVFDASGTLFAVGNLPDTYKPMASEGAYADTVVRLEFLVANAGLVTLQLDPNVIVATQTWISNNVTACTIIPGGTTGQVLRKASNGCGDTEWADPTEVSVVVSTIEENQTLAAAQTSVILAVVTTNGLAVYVQGERLDRALGVNGWQPDPLDPDSTIILGASYTAGSRITLVQNEPLGDVPFPLARDQNLADVPDKAVGRTNLDVFSKAEARQLAPASQIAYFARSTAPTGWLKANGAAISRTAYADLFAAIGTTFGAGNGFDTFNLPDLRDVMPIGADNLYSVGVGGGSRDATLVSHTHGASTGGQSANHTHTGTTSWVGDHTHPATTNFVSTAAINQPYRLAGDDGSFTGNPAYNTPGVEPAGGHNHTFGTSGVSSDHSHAVTINAAGASATGANLPPFKALLACIKF